MDSLRVQTIAKLSGVSATGGGLAAVPGGVLLMSGDGRLFFLAIDQRSNILAKSVELAEPVELDGALAIDTAAFARHFASESGDFRYRVTSIVVDTTVQRPQVVAAHTHLDTTGSPAGGPCLSLRVSTRAVSLSPTQNAEPWITVYTTSPCLPPHEDLDTYESGGRLAFAGDGTLFLSVGDFGHNGLRLPAVAQDSTVPYGKLLLLSLDGAHRTYSTGHRNMQGVVQTTSGALWSVEHGPQGGDEVNAMREGGNYGWPFATYGTDYGRRTWPGAEFGPKDAEYEAPAHAFVPSVAPSGLLELRGAMWDGWQGDLLITTLRAQSLLRVRTDGSAVRYVERIELGARIRDAVQLGDGTLVVWTEDATVLTLRPVRTVQ